MTDNERPPGEQSMNLRLRARAVAATPQQVLNGILSDAKAIKTHESKTCQRFVSDLENIINETKGKLTTGQIDKLIDISTKLKVHIESKQDQSSIRKVLTREFASVQGKIPADARKEFLKLLDGSGTYKEGGIIKKLQDLKSSLESPNPKPRGRLGAG
mgnify:CR=1 FL=1